MTVSAPAAREDVRLPAVAGSWYPGDAAELAAYADRVLDAAAIDADCARLPLALVAPHAGYRYSGAVAAAAFAAIRGCDVRRVWLFGPSHHLGHDGAAIYREAAFRTPLGDLPVARDAVEALADKPGFSLVPASGDGGEHSLEMELPLLQRALGSFELVPLLVGQLDPESARTMADSIRPLLGKGDLVVVSSDFTHHGPRFRYAPFKDDLATRISEIDHAAWARVAAPDTPGFAAELARTGATVCGRHPLLLLTALLDPSARGSELRYTTSGELTGDWTNSVSYLAGRIDGPPWAGAGPGRGTARFVPPSTGEALRQLAEKTLHHWFAEGEILPVDEGALPPGATEVLGAFVTLEKDGELRGCIGEITPRREAWKAVREHALDAALRDGRFAPVTAGELGSIEVEVSLLGPSRPVWSARDLILGRHGVVLSLGRARATFLPQVAPEQGWGRAETLSHLARKAGIPSAAISEAAIEVYEAQVVAPPDGSPPGGGGG